MVKLSYRRNEAGTHKASVTFLILIIALNMK